MVATGYRRMQPTDEVRERLDKQIRRAGGEAKTTMHETCDGLERSGERN